MNDMKQGFLLGIAVMGFLVVLLIINSRMFSVSVAIDGFIDDANDNFSEIDNRLKALEAEKKHEK